MYSDGSTLQQTIPEGLSHDQGHLQDVSNIRILLFEEILLVHACPTSPAQMHRHKSGAAKGRFLALTLASMKDMSCGDANNGHFDLQ